MIATDYGVSHKRLRRELVEFGTEMRTRAEAQRLLHGDPLDLDDEPGPTLCECGRLANRHDDRCTTCRVHPPCRCGRLQIRVRAYLGRWACRRCGCVER
jgi:hypothetical protein